MIRSNKKIRFPLGEYQRLKKERVNSLLQSTLEADEQLQSLEAQLTAKKGEIDSLAKKLHSKEEIIRRRKRKVFVVFSTLLHF